MDIQIRHATYPDVQEMRELYREELNCQIIHDSAISRGMAEPYLILVAGRVGGYGAVWKQYAPHRLMEFYALSHTRNVAPRMFRELLIASKASHIEAQTNNPLMLSMLHGFATNITAIHLLFRDAFASQLPLPMGTFRRIMPEDTITMFKHHVEPVGEWGIEVNGSIVATAGYFCHYNPPYADIYMEVDNSSRRKGYGSYLVQEVKRVCREAGKTPAARCNPANEGSRRTLEKAGFIQCGQLLAGNVRVLN
jgi:GNAT superfamily N-acetyltransferase